MIQQEESLQEIIRRYRAQGYSLQEAVGEWHRQAKERLREGESAILEAVRRLDPNDDSFRARHLRELAEQINDHREAGHYTTQG